MIHKTAKQRIALVTYSGIETYSSSVPNEDFAVTRVLTERGFLVENAVWNDPRTDWKIFDKIVVKSTWDYFDFPVAWFRWLDHLEHAGVPTANPLKTIRWNSDKIYLKEVAERGYPIVQSEWYDQNSRLDSSVFEKLLIEKIVIKPRIGGGAKDTFAVRKEEFSTIAPVLNRLLQQGSFIVQPFLSQIGTAGEYSFLFIDGVFSHAVVKKPRPGDFRVQHLFGGTVKAAEVPESYVVQVRQIYEHFAADCLHARIDMIDLGDGNLAVMELELIEPYLFLHLAESGVEKYAEAISRDL